MMTDGHNQLRLLPSVDELLQTEAGQQLSMEFSRALALQAVRQCIAAARDEIRQGAACPAAEELLARAAEQLHNEQRAHLLPVVNATGVIINTNLGRAP